ncbi:MAG: hypothetical protein ACYS9X_26420 [Planctomycetota bacterium]|jgi:hypothetical protein
MKREWSFCPACRRAFQSDVPDDYRPGQVIEEVGQLCLDEDGDEWWKCPLKGCDGATVHCIHWSVFKKAHPELPEVPYQGARYP